MTRSTPQRLLALFMIVTSAGRLAAQSVTRPHYIGVSSCTAAACHGSSQQQNRPAWQSAYTVWTTQDPHANAYATLFNERSREIVQILRGGQPSSEQYQQALQERCIGCHATPAAPEVPLAEGVSCEACHGAASSWLEPHTRTSWPTLAARNGQTNTVDLYARADICVRCHVGPSIIQGQLYDVNHDLVAAGHPRLTFEFSAYLANVPAHWDVTRDRTWTDKLQKERRADFDAESWIVGQLASSRSALALLRSRATSPGAVWPEFAEHDCYACHHGLRPRPASLQPSRGIAAWGTWHSPLVRLLARQAGDEPLIKNLDVLSSEMQRPLPDANTAAELAATAMLSIDELSQHFAMAMPERTTLLSAVAKDSGHWKNWDEATQWYLAIAALTGAYDTSSDKNAALRQALDAFRSCLEKPLSSAELILDPNGSRQVQPYNLDPDHPQFRKALAQLLEQLK